MKVEFNCEMSCYERGDAAKCRQTIAIRRFTSTAETCVRKGGVKKAQQTDIGDHDVHSQKEWDKPVGRVAARAEFLLTNALGLGHVVAEEKFAENVEIWPGNSIVSTWN